jgi:hypothetical protein
MDLCILLASALLSKPMVMAIHIARTNSIISSTATCLCLTSFVLGLELPSDLAYSFS